MALYELTNLTSSTTIVDIVKFSNEVTSGWMVALFVIAVFIIMVVALKNYGFDNSLATASFSCFIIAGLFSYVGLLNIIFPIAFLTMLALAGLYMYMTKE